MLKPKFESAIKSIKNVHLHHLSEVDSEAYCINQIHNSFILVGLGNGDIIFYKKENLVNPFYKIHVDGFPITNLVEISDKFISCSSAKPSLIILGEHPQIKNEYEIKSKINLRSSSGSINKLILLPNDIISSVDNMYISLWTFKSQKNIELIKEKKIGTPISDIISLNKNTLVCALPLKKSLLFFDSEKLTQTYEIKDLKFVNSLEFNNILCLMSNDFLFVAGCSGNAYLINLKHKEFVANVKLTYNEEIITSVYELINGNLLCGISVLMQDPVNSTILVSSDLVQYDYKPDSNRFQVINRIKDTHNGIIRCIKEIINHKEMKELVSVSFDSTVKIWN